MIIQKLNHQNIITNITYLHKICETEPPCDGDPNAYYEQCGLYCDERTCQNKDTISVCKPETLEKCKLKGKCVCKEDYVKNSEGKCVLPEDCEIDSYRQKSIGKMMISCTCILIEFKNSHLIEIDFSSPISQHLIPQPTS